MKVIQAIREINQEMDYARLHPTRSSGTEDSHQQGGKTMRFFVEPGQPLIITSEEMVGTREKISTSYQSLPSDVGGRRHDPDR